MKNSINVLREVFAYNGPMIVLTLTIVGLYLGTVALGLSLRGMHI